MHRALSLVIYHACGHLPLASPSIAAPRLHNLQPGQAVSLFLRAFAVRRRALAPNFQYVKERCVERLSQATHRWIRVVLNWMYGKGRSGTVSGTEAAGAIAPGLYHSRYRTSPQLRRLNELPHAVQSFAIRSRSLPQRPPGKTSAGWTVCGASTQRLPTGENLKQ